jgi:hypothetical protein
MADSTRRPVGTAVCGELSPDGRLSCALGAGHDGDHADGEDLTRTAWSLSRFVSRPQAPELCLADFPGPAGTTCIRPKGHEDSQGTVQFMADEHLDCDGRRWRGATVLTRDLPGGLPPAGSMSAAEWRALYEQREAEFQQARSEADDAQVRLTRLQEGYQAHVAELQRQVAEVSRDRDWAYEQLAYMKVNRDELQARSEADDARVALSRVEGERDRLSRVAGVAQVQLESTRALFDRDRADLHGQLDAAHARVAQLDAQVAEQAAMIEQLRAGKSIGPERAASGGPASSMLSDARHLYTLAGELRAALAPFCGGG